MKLKFFIVLILAVFVFARDNKNYKKILTTGIGTPVASNQNSLSAGEQGPLLLQDFHLIDKLAHFDRERIPERVVHAKGAGAHGFFEVTNDKIKRYTKASFLRHKGKKTPVFVRFSTVGGEKGSADTARDPRGFAIKFYTDEGNQDLVGNNTPVFFIRDPVKFPDFIHTQKRNPQTNLKDANAVWDFFSYHPEATRQFSILFSDMGTPDGYRHMNGFSSHTLKLVNKKGEQFWVKWHFIADAGIKNLTAAEATRLAGEDPDYATRDLFNHIHNGGTVSWTLYFQILTYEQGYSYRYNIFDVTKTIDEADYPLIPVGKLVLNRNPSNFFAEVEQAAFSPSHMVPGVEPSPDKMLQGRLFSYPDTHRHRLGPNNLQIPINRPINTKFGPNHQRDGAMTVTDNGGSTPNYEQNSFGGPYEDEDYKTARFPVNGKVDRHPPVVNHPNDDFVQTGEMYRSFSETDKAHLIENIVSSLGQARVDIQKRAVKLFYRCDEDYGKRLATALNLGDIFTNEGYPATTYHGKNDEDDDKKRTPHENL